MALTRIERYQVMYSANRFAPRIWLHGGTGGIGQLVFHPNGAVLPEDGLAGGSPSLHYHLDDFQNIIDLLRNEKPAWLLYSGSGGGFENGVRTDAENVGEGETLPRFAIAGAK